MEYIASHPGATFHASKGREKVSNKTATGGQGWAWKAKGYCGKEVTGISGNAVATIIDCKGCQAALRREGYEV